MFKLRNPCKKIKDVCPSSLNKHLSVAKSCKYEILKNLLQNLTGKYANLDLNTRKKKLE